MEYIKNIPTKREPKDVTPNRKKPDTKPTEKIKNPQPAKKPAPRAPPANSVNRSKKPKKPLRNVLKRLKCHKCKLPKPRKKHHAPIRQKQKEEDDKERDVKPSQNGKFCHTFSSPWFCDDPKPQPEKRLSEGSDKVAKDYKYVDPPPDFTYYKLVTHTREKALEEGKPVIRQLSFGSHLMALCPDQQRDSEWLQLSASSDGEDETITALRSRIKTHKPYEKYMSPSLYYASQKFYRSVASFFFILRLTVRNPFTISPCYRNRIVMLLIYRKEMIAYSLSTLLFCLAFVFCFINIIDIKYTTETGDFEKTEYKELSNYTIPIGIVLSNFLLAAVWSLGLLLYYCVELAHYYNMNSRFMGLSDMNPSFSISTYTKFHIFCYWAYVAIVVTSFYFDWPMVTRGVFGQVFYLLTRQLYPGMRFIPRHIFFTGEIAALLLYLYAVWANHTFFILLHQSSLVIRNQCERWNLNFSLRFHLNTSAYKAKILKTGTQASLVKLYAQHRVITELANFYGRIFLVPICIFVVTNLAVATVILIAYIKYEEPPPGTDFFYRWDNNNEIIPVVRSLPKQDEMTTLFFIFCQSILEFLQGSLGISWGATAMETSFEFVRRQGLVLCNTQHERRFIQSLYISFAEARSPLLTAGAYFGLSKTNIFAGLMAVTFFWTMIIQCQVEQPTSMIEWVARASNSCGKLPLQSDVNGKEYCMISHKYRKKLKARLYNRRINEISKFQTDENATLKYWFFEDCTRNDLAEYRGHVSPDLYGSCTIDFKSGDERQFSKRAPKSVPKPWFDHLKTRWDYAQRYGWWYPPRTHKTHSRFPCDWKTTGPPLKEYYRDFFMPCKSKVLDRDLILPVMFSQTVRTYGVGPDGYYMEIAVYQPRNALFDCGINPYSIQDERMLATCSGVELSLDDCGNPNAPHFTDSLSFVKSPALKYYRQEIPELPENYRAAGFKSYGTLRCWESFGASERCTDPTIAQFCRISKSTGTQLIKAYLFGKDCYTFEYFSVFVDHDGLLFCLHPQSQEDRDRGAIQWVSEQEYSAGMSRFANANATKKTKRATSGSGRLVRLRNDIDQVKGSIPARVNTPRNAIFANFFPCENTQSILGWLPEPYYRTSPGGTLTKITFEELGTKREGPCWSDPYPIAAFEGTNPIEVVDWQGRPILDDCFSHWWSPDPDIFIPDDVLMPSPIERVIINKRSCWDVKRAKKRCETQSSVCMK